MGSCPECRTELGRFPEKDHPWCDCGWSVSTPCFCPRCEKYVSDLDWDHKAEMCTTCTNEE